MIIYHPSNKKFTIVKTKYFGQNYYTKNDVKASGVKRTFWYLKYPIPEDRFINSQFIYVAKVRKKRIYDLRKDKKYLIEKYQTIDKLLRYLKKHYLGIRYNVLNWDLIVIFQNIKPIKVIERT